jgi:hypothetical protein
MNETEPDMRREDAMASDDRVTRRLGARRLNAWPSAKQNQRLRETPVRGGYARRVDDLNIFGSGAGVAGTGR